MKEAGAMAPHESGGVLMGYWSADGTEVVISHLIHGGPAADRKGSSFMPDHAFQEAEIARVYVESGRIATYLGDWHSHPGGSTNLSSIDRCTLVAILRAPQARLQLALLAVVAGGPHWAIDVWVASRTRFLVRRIRISAALITDL